MPGEKRSRQYLVYLSAVEKWKEDEAQLRRNPASRSLYTRLLRNIERKAQEHT
ncbi:hypothetical protein ACFL1E_07130 [Candidatus Omnitrophota bacterium]